MAATFNGAMNSKRQLGRKNETEMDGHGGVDRALRLHAPRETQRRQGAKTQSSRGCAGCWREWQRCDWPSRLAS